MALGDVTDPSAVLRAIAEFRDLGRDEFLRTYGYRNARNYFLRHDGELFDSKAIVGAAHWHQHGEALAPNEFSGGEDTVARLLRNLGFEVERYTDVAWTIAEDQIVTRTEVKDLYGGSPYGGIEASNSSPNVLIYTDPAQGALNGYDYDGWDEHDEGIFYYTGEGRRGDQTLTKGNKAILEHEETGRTLRLFEAIDTTQRPGGKRHRYMGAFRIDPSEPYRFEPAPDADGNQRQVVVFRLIHERTDHEEIPQPTVELEEPVSSGAPDSHGTDAAVEDADAVLDTPETHTEEESPFVELVPSERNTTLENEIPPRAGGIARREEAQLVSYFESNLRARGHTVLRARISIPGEANTLVTDTYDSTDNVLYEAKSKSDRSTVRLGIGQLLDYLRFLPGTRGRLLLPNRPTDDLCTLIKSCGLGIAYRDAGNWVLDD